VYVSDNKLIFHESIPGVPSSPLALGAPITYITHRVSTLRPITMKYKLSTDHMKLAGCKDIGDEEIHKMVMGVAMEEADLQKAVCLKATNGACSSALSAPMLLSRYGGSTHLHTVLTTGRIGEMYFFTVPDR
jgi:hypothetical protein